MKIEFKSPNYKSSDLRKSDIYIRQDKVTGKMFVIQRKENYQQTRTEKQAKTRSSFGIRCHAVSEWLKKPENLESATYAEIMRDYNRQSRYVRLSGFLIANAERYEIINTEE